MLLNRWFGFHKENNNGIELHVFCDASAITYGAVAYLKCISIDKVNQFAHLLCLNPD